MRRPPARHPGPILIILYRYFTLGARRLVSPQTKVVIVRTADADGIDPPYWREVFQYIADTIAEKDQPRPSAPR